jgi:Protein of unknown function (DUF3631)
MATKTPTLIDRLKSFIRRYVVLPEHELEVMSHYVLHTHQFSERCQMPWTTPYIFVNSAQKGSGKTLLGIDLMQVLCRNFESVNNVTPATLFRLTEIRATIGIDEVDVLFTGSRADDDIVSTMNTGYRKGGYVPRADSKAEDGVRRYSTYSPKVLVGIDSGTMKDTTRDRCIPITMKRATDAERQTVVKFLHYKIEDEVDALQQDIWNWSLENTVGMRDYEPKEILTLNPRQWEICQPLLQVAKATGRESHLRAALIAIFAANTVSEETVEVDMLRTLLTMFTTQGNDKVVTADLLVALRNDPRFRNWNGRVLGLKLATFGIDSKTTRYRPGEMPGNQNRKNVQRSISREQCEDAFIRYLPGYADENAS